MRGTTHREKMFNLRFNNIILSKDKMFLFLVVTFLPKDKMEATH